MILKMILNGNNSVKTTGSSPECQLGVFFFFFFGRWRFELLVQFCSSQRGTKCVLLLLNYPELDQMVVWRNANTTPEPGDTDLSTA